MKTDLKRLSFLLLLLPLAFLPGCGPLAWIKNKLNGTSQSSSSPAIHVDANDEVLFTLDGKPLITVKTLDRDFDQLLKDNPQLQAVLPLMENAKHDIFMGMVNQEMVNKYIEDKGVNNTKEYQDEWERMLRSVRYMLNTKYFAAQHPVNITDAEVKKYYEENKETMPGLLVSRGGVNATGVAFDKEVDAKAFADKAKGKDFAATVREAGLNNKLRDFKGVSATTAGMDAGLRDKIVAIKTFPVVTVIKAEGKYWVIHVSGTQGAQYCPYDQAKPSLQQYVEKEKRTEMFEKEINRLKGQYNVIINEDYFKKHAAPQEVAQPAVPEQAHATPVAAPTHAA